MGMGRGRNLIFALLFISCGNKRLIKQQIRDKDVVISFYWESYITSMRAFVAADKGDETDTLLSGDVQMIRGIYWEHDSIFIRIEPESINGVYARRSEAFGYKVFIDSAYASADSVSFQVFERLKDRYVFENKNIVQNVGVRYVEPYWMIFEMYTFNKRTKQTADFYDTAFLNSGKVRPKSPIDYPACDFVYKRGNTETHLYIEPSHGMRLRVESGIDSLYPSCPLTSVATLKRDRLARTPGKAPDKPRLNKSMKIEN